MDDMLKFIIIVLAANLLCAILVYIIQFRKNKTKGLLLALIIIICASFSCLLFGNDRSF